MQFACCSTVAKPYSMLLFLRPSLGIGVLAHYSVSLLPIYITHFHVFLIWALRIVGTVTLHRLANSARESLETRISRTCCSVNLVKPCIRLCCPRSNIIKFSGRLSRISPLIWWTISLLVNSRPSSFSITRRCSEIVSAIPYRHPTHYDLFSSFSTIIPDKHNLVKVNLITSKGQTSIKT